MCIDVNPFFHSTILIIYVFAATVDNGAPFHSCRYGNTWCIILQKMWGAEIKLSVPHSDTQTDEFDTEMERGDLGSFVTQGYEAISNLRTQQAAKCVLRVQ